MTEAHTDIADDDRIFRQGQFVFIAEVQFLNAERLADHGVLFRGEVILCGAVVAEFSDKVTLALFSLFITLSGILFPKITLVRSISLTILSIASIRCFCQSRRVFFV